MDVEPIAQARFADLESRFGNRFIVKDVPGHELPARGMPAVDAMRLIGQAQLRR